MKRLQIFLMFSTIIASSQAQNFVKGCVQDSVSVLPDANVLFFQNDSLTAGIYTDKNGCFTIDLDTGKYVMTIILLGHQNYVEEITLTGENIHLSPIVMEIVTTELGEVLVSGEKKMYEAQMNRDIYRIPESIKKASSDIFLTLQNIPALSVNELDKSIRLIGADNSVVLVNNIRRNKEYLQLISPENIDRIEISHSPGASYFVKGIDGIINIITKTPSIGYNGYLKAEANTLFEYANGGGGINLVGDKIAASFNVVDFFFQDRQREISLIRDANNIHTDKRNTGYDAFMRYSYLSANLDYSISPKTFITFNTDYSIFPWQEEIPYAIRLSSFDGSPRSDLEALHKKDTKDGTYNANTYFQTEFSEKQSLNMEIGYTSSKNKSDNDYSESDNGSYRYENHQLIHNDWHSINTQINFLQKTEKIEWEEGILFQWADNRFHKEANGVSTMQQQQKLYNYVYANALGSLNKKWTYRIENIFDWVKMIDNQKKSHVYKGFTPRVMLRYLIDNNQNITFFYALTHSYPDFSLLNPIPVYVDSSRVVTGNPDLKPFFRHGFRLNYQIVKPAVKNLFFQTAIVYQIMDDNISQKENLDSNGVYQITYENAAHRSNLNFLLASSIDIFKGLKIKVEGSARYVMFNDDYQAQFNKKYWEYSLSWESQFHYKNFMINYEHYPFFRTPTLTGYLRGEGLSYLSLNYKLNQWGFRIVLREFTPKIYRLETYTDDYSEVYTNIMTERTRQINLSISYFFEKGKQNGMKQKKTKHYETGVGSDTRSF
jgi:hypothetical protein